MRHMNEFPIEMMCKVFAISESSFTHGARLPSVPMLNNGEKPWRLFLRGARTG